MRPTLISLVLAKRVQLSTDGHHAYLVAVQAAWLHQPIDYAMLIKIYGDSATGFSPGANLHKSRRAK